MKVVFSSNELAPELDERERKALWHELYMETIYPFDVAYLPEEKLSVRFELSRIGELGFAKCDWMVSRVTPSRSALTDPRDFFALSFNHGPSSMFFVSNGKLAEIRAGSAALLRPEFGDQAHYTQANRFSGVTVPIKRLTDVVPGAEEMVGREIPGNPHLLNYIRRYIELVLGEAAPYEDCDLANHVDTAVVDLLALALNGSREMQEIARGRGLRAARFRDIVDEIKRGFGRPDFSAEDIATKLGVSANYVQKILAESGRTFTERVQELRLQKAREMLADLRFDGMKMSDVAFACGFNDLSHFNRCFRRRFGASPTQFRGNGDG
jgi:AraC-like DNA-binding protein